MNNEANILEYWRRIRAFERSLELTDQKEEYVFYDGPPFGTGQPHYGHLVGSTIKDIVGRYKTMTGYHVRRVWGWDTHGLPIEFEIEKELGIKTKQQVLEYGIKNYNSACREIVLRYRDQWKTTIERLGRWVDMDNDYKTMDPSFMESVWWVFGQLYTKGLVYRGYKVVPYCMRCGTPLSNFEAKDNYQQVSDWSLTVKFGTPSKYNHGSESYNSYLLVWTTTPWSLITNLLLCINPNTEYCYLLYEDEVYTIATDCIENYFKKKKYQVLERFKGRALVGMAYNPPFNYYSSYGKKGGFKVVADDYVKADNGTGIVHCSPAHGEDDYRVALKEGILEKEEEPPCPLDDNGVFIDPIVEWKGLNVKESEKPILDYLTEKGLVFNKGKISHPYPYCWRSDTPLIYKVCESWYINVQEIKENMVKNNKGTSWVPSHIRDHRFGKWIEGSTDWCVSRNRFWGTPVPIWTNGTETVCIGSVRELEKLAHLKDGSITDLHRDSIDHIVIPSSKGLEPLKRVEYVFDCWFESGSMPYGQVGYKGDGPPPTPADFIAEGLDQTRGWFYTLMVLGTALFDQSPYKNVIVNGIVLNEKGEKMSKRKKNYPPVETILDKYGADALRLYLISTPVVKGEDLKFKEKDIKEIKRKYHMMVNNMVRFYQEMVGLYNQRNPDNPFVFVPTRVGDIVTTNIMDIWILTCLNDLLVSVHQNMDQYHLNGIVEKFFKFIDQLSRWYVNLNKKRFKACDNPTPLQILHTSLYHFSLVTAPFAPFMAEIVYQTLVNKNHNDSVHFCSIPKQLGFGYEFGCEFGCDNTLIELFDYFSDVVDLVRSVRNNRTNEQGEPICSVKLGLHMVTLVHSDPMVLDNLRSIEPYIKEELNIDEVRYDTNLDSYVSYSLSANVPVIKTRVTGREIGKVMKTIKQLKVDLINRLVTTKDSVLVDDVLVRYEEINVEMVPKVPNVVAGPLITLHYDDTVNTEIMEKYYAKLFYRAYQEARKEAGLVQTDRIDLWVEGIDRDIVDRYYPDLIIDGHRDNPIYTKNVTIEGDDVWIYLYW